ncbi:MAG TPA: lysylphosphatidylglycerol synthase transmembrane domain-containing protein [Bacteroidales bacterium]|jgi:uncharacterized protein (TIRG00374 family)|nr:flippase-like domain-containing protein [Bacteroidales bacterium]HQA86797.1 lysylphosphatidylglycerol synthase transmembrane domain-containing protein [Bacteroidales bacterium]HRT13544.1 lysylphosphatidylglycerol synthase transmembrane domain-containing protein [Bacteroidales bacterium]
MSEKIKRLIQLIIFIGIGVFFVWLSVRNLEASDIQSIKESASQVRKGNSWFFLLLSSLFIVLAHVFRGLRSVLLLEPLNYKVRKSSSIYAVFVAYFANLAIPRIGEILRCTFLQHHEKVPFQKSIGTIVTERALDLIIFLLLFVIAILINQNAFSDIIIDREQGVSLGMRFESMMQSLLFSYKIYIFLLVTILLIVIIYLTRKQWRKIPFLIKIKNFGYGIWQGLISIKDLKHPFYFILYTFLIWFSFYLSTYACFFAFDFLSHLGPVAALSVLGFGTLGFVIAQGGLGAAPLIIAATLVLYNVDYNGGLAAGWINWALQTVTVIVAGLLSLLLASLSKKKTDEEYKTN